MDVAYKVDRRSKILNISLGEENFLHLFANLLDDSFINNLLFFYALDNIMNIHVIKLQKQIST